MLKQILLLYPAYTEWRYKGKMTLPKFKKQVKGIWILNQQLHKARVIPIIHCQVLPEVIHDFTQDKPC